MADSLLVGFILQAQSIGTAWIIDQSHKSHNAPVPYPTIHHLGTEMGTFLFQNGVLWDMGQVYSVIGVLWVLYRIVTVLVNQTWRIIKNRALVNYGISNTIWWRYHLASEMYLVNSWCVICKILFWLMIRIGRKQEWQFKFELWWKKCYLPLGPEADLWDNYIVW